jgi:glycosyltransferase involved in cell wall biosynthesis
MEQSSNEIMVSICCLAYNHEKFIRQALDSFLNQEVNFKYEVLIHDDASQDATQDIIREYQQAHPEVIFPLLQTENQRSKTGGGMDPRYNYPRSRGKYIAVCEGDDFWTDMQKLQTQINFLEENQDYSGCFCEHRIVDEHNNLTKPMAANFKRDIDQNDVFKSGGWYANAGLVFRNTLVFDFDHFKGINGGDRYHAVLLTDNEQKIGYLNKEMCAYRVHSGGIYSKKSEVKKYLKIFQDFKKYQSSKYNKKYSADIKKKLSASAYVLGEDALRNREWKDYFYYLGQSLACTTLNSRIFNLKMFVGSFIRPLFSRKSSQ